MPVVTYGDYGKYGQTTEVSRTDYNYPEGLDLRPGSELHKRLVDEVLQRARESHSLISNRISAWNEIERTTTAYVDITEDEQKVKEKDYRKPVSIVFPYSYVILETLLTYLVMAFMNDPIFRYAGVSSEDVPGAMLLEKVVQNQCVAFKVGLALHTYLRDSLTYGLGIGAPIWDRRLGNVPKLDFYGRREYEEKTIYEGNRLLNVDPYLYLPDPKVPVQNTQDGEYVGWIETTNKMVLLKREKVSDGKMFNVRYVSANSQGKRSSIFAQGESDRSTKTGVSSYTVNTTINNPVDVIYMYIELIPKEFKLGTSEYPERWLFALANDDVIIQAGKLNLAHGMYPVATIAPDFDGYSSLPVARSEILYGMQTVLDFLFNSHIANVRKAINDMLIVDPYQVNMADLKDPGAGKLIRLRRPAWGKGVKDVVQQLAVNDITKSNIPDSGVVVQWMEKVGGTDSSLQGSLRSGGPERLTGTEFEGTRASATSRIERLARVIGMQGMYDLGYMFACHTQQLMKEETYVRITGRMQEEMQATFGPNYAKMVKPSELYINFDVQVNDGSLPSGQGDLWMQMYKILAENQGLSQNFDMVRIFTHIAQILGAKNVQDFKINTQIVPDEVALNMAKAGNVVPLNRNRMEGGGDELQGEYPGAGGVPGFGNME